MQLILFSHDPAEALAFAEVTALRLHQEGLDPLIYQAPLPVDESDDCSYQEAVAERVGAFQDWLEGLESGQARLLVQPTLLEEVLAMLDSDPDTALACPDEEGDAIPAWLAGYLAWRAEQGWAIPLFSHGEQPQ